MCIRDRLMREKFDTIVFKAPVLQKFKLLAEVSKAIIAIRDKEETRGGEIAELVYLIYSGFSEKICLFKREGITLSSMLMEFLDYANVVLRSYRNTNELVSSVIRYLNYRLRKRS